ncbi:MAG TPA: WD40 repeat domain-containing protein, partial [Hyphomicrobiaceae bacterium]|nr:WD40 repeat domain-containing protein [Hyphomicrobiaceae bacterium]
GPAPPASAADVPEPQRAQTVRPAAPGIPPALEHAPDKRLAAQRTVAPVSLPPQAPVERRHPIRERRGWFFLRQPWRGLIAKFSIGVAVASLLVAYQNQLPQSPPAEPRSAATGNPARTVSSGETASLATSARTLPEPAVIGAHDGALVALAHTNGSRIVTVGADRTLRVWDATAGAPLRTVALTDGPASSVAVDGDTAVTSHGDGTIALWDIEAGRRLGSYKSGAASVTATAIFDKGARFASAGGDGRIQLWERQALSGPVSVTEAHAGAVTSLARFEARDGLLTGGADKALKLFGATGLQSIRRYRGHRGAVTHIDSVAGGSLLASGDDDGQLRFWSIASQRLIRKISAHDGAMTALRISPRTDVVATAGADGILKLWDARRGRLIASAKPQGGRIRGLAFVDGGRRLLSGSEDGRIRSWDLQRVEIARD